MKRALPLVSLFLCACTAFVGVNARPGYSETRIAAVAESEVFYRGDEESTDRTSRKLVVYENAKPESFSGIRHDSCEEVGFADGPCEVFRAGRHEIINGIMTSQADLSAPEIWSVYVNKRLLFSAPMYFGAEGPVLQRRIVAGKPAVTFRRDLRGTVTQDAPSPSDIPLDTFYDGSFLSDRYWIEGSHGLFSYKGIIGFVGKQDGKEYVFYNGVPVTEAFDAIRTHSCCMVPRTDLRVYDDGSLYFAGERGKYVYHTKVDLNASGAEESAQSASVSSNASR